VNLQITDSSSLAPSRERAAARTFQYRGDGPDGAKDEKSVWDSNWHSRSKSQQIQPLVARPASAGDACENRVEVQNRENVGNQQVFGCVSEVAGCLGRFPQLDHPCGVRAAAVAKRRSAFRAILVFPRKSSHFNNFLDRAIWLLLALRLRKFSTAQDCEMVSRIFVSWNRIGEWLRRC
jgi:hypothetical protein